MHQTIVHFTTLWSFLVDILKGTICIFLQAWLNNIYIFSICHSLLNKCWALLEIPVVNIDAILKYKNCIYQCSYSLLMIFVVLLHCTFNIECVQWNLYWALFYILNFDFSYNRRECYNWSEKRTILIMYNRIKLAYPRSSNHVTPLIMLWWAFVIISSLPNVKYLFYSLLFLVEIDIFLPILHINI